MLYHSYERSIISYGLLINGNAENTTVDLIEKAQRRITRFLQLTQFQEFPYME